MVMNNNLLDIYHDDSIEKSELYIDNRIGLYDSMTVNPLYSYFNYEDINEIRSCGFNLVKLNEFMEKQVELTEEFILVIMIIELLLK